jgi:hypothetical protein
MSGNNHIKLDDDSYLEGTPYTPNSEKEYKIEYTFPETDIFSSEVQNLNDRITLNYSSSDTYPNLILKDYVNYSAHEITFVKLIHNIFPGITEETNADSDADGPKIIGEMVVRMSPLTNATEPLYLCFLLKKSNSETNSNTIDKIINMSVTADNMEKVRISDDIPKQINQPATAVTYSSNGTGSTTNKVIVFITPILINNNSVDILNALTQYTFEDKFYGTYQNLPNDDNIAGSKKTYILHEPKFVMKSNAENDIYIDCNPSGETDETIAAYNVPINSAYTQGKTKDDIRNNAISLSIFVLLFAAVYFFAPSLYFYVVYKKMVLKNTFQNINDKASFIRNVDFSSLVLLIALFVYLVTSNNSLAVSYAIYYLFILGLSVMLIISNKTNNPDWQKVINYNDNDIKFQYSGFAPQEIFDKNGLIYLFLSIIAYPVYNVSARKLNIPILVANGLFLAFYFIYLYLIYTDWNKKDIGNYIIGAILGVVAISLLFFISGFNDKAT